MGWQKITFSISWAPKWLKYHTGVEGHEKGRRFELGKDAVIANPVPSTGLCVASAVRVGTRALHGIRTTLTPSRVLSLDEIGLFLEPNSKGAFTVLLCTSASGHIHLALAKRAVRVAVISGAMDMKDALFEISDRTRLPAFDSAVVTAALQGTSLRPRS